MTDAPILAAGQTREVVLDGTRYILRAPTHRQHAQMQAALAGQRMPSTDYINARLVEAARGADCADLAEDLLAEGEARDALEAFQAGAPPALDEAGIAAWEATHAEELLRLRRAVLAAQRKGRVAREHLATCAAAREMQAQAAAAMEASQRHLVAAGLGIALDAVAEMNAGHVRVLADEVQRLLVPSRDAAKN